MRTTLDIADDVLQSAQVRGAGRIIGALVISHMILGVLVNFVLEAPLFDAPGFLVNAAQYSRQIGFAALLGLITEALWIGIGIEVSSRRYES